MNIPDPAVYASLGTIGAGLVWAARQFVFDTLKTSGPKGDRGDKGEQGQPGPEMSVREFKEFARIIKDEFNGRYPLASEVREQFAKLTEQLGEMRLDITETRRKVEDLHRQQ